MKKLLWYNPLKYGFFALLGLLAFMSCDKDDTNVDSVTKELLATVSTDKTVANGAEVKFIDLSLGVKNRVWTFPGGDPATSDIPEVDVVFAEEGEVLATLEVEYVDGTKESTEFPITVFPVLVADFTASETRIKVGETVTFTDISVGDPTSWLWEFEGGTPATSTEQNPTVTFNVNKPVTVSLTVTRALDESEAVVEKVDLVQVGPPELMLNGDFEDGAIVGWQTWRGGGFPYAVEDGGANGTTKTSYFNYEAAWGFAQLISRDKDPSITIAVENGKNYTISAYVKAATAGVANLNGFRLVNHLPDWSSSLPAGGTPEGYSEYYPISGSSLPVALTTDWQFVSIVVSIPDDGNSRTNAFPDLIFGSDSDVKISVDEISIKIVE
jgi:PKD repeat protein